MGKRTARALAEAGHIVDAGMRATNSRNTPTVAALAQVKKNHFAPVGAPAETVRAAEHEEPYGRLRDTMTEAPSRIFPPGREGREVVSITYDRIRAEFFHRVGIDELLTPCVSP
ncbi:hypothetical protein [Streptomyces sp. NBC_00453]|uniref:hypothetical protein n=1 Tax=Streptomyces sp. NBC_00453 TaxID=2903653 RepID=UPI002E1FDD0E